MSPRSNIKKQKTLQKGGSWRQREPRSLGAAAVLPKTKTLQKGRVLEASSGFEPLYKLLQSCA